MVVSKTKKSTVKKKPVASGKVSKRVRTNSLRRARAREFSRKSHSVARTVILVVIGLTMLTVVLGVLAARFNHPEHVVSRRIEEISADYYENYFYDKLKDYASESRPFDKIMKYYENSGFSKVTLRDLLLFDNERHAADANLLKKYCDESATYVKFYPVEPFGKKDYRAEYNYSCVF